MRPIPNEGSMTEGMKFLCRNQGEVMLVSAFNSTPVQHQPAWCLFLPRASGIHHVAIKCCGVYIWIFNGHRRKNVCSKHTPAADLLPHALYADHVLGDAEGRAAHGQLRLPGLGQVILHHIYIYIMYAYDVYQEFNDRYLMSTMERTRYLQTEP